MTEINRGILISFMKKGLKQQEEGSFGDLLRSVMQKLLEAKIIRYDRPDRLSYGYHIIAMDDKRIGQQFCECYAWLLFNGVIIPEPGLPNFISSNNFNVYCLTDWGRQWIENEDEQLPEYEDGYVQFLKSSINNIDDIVIQYISESIRTFNNNHIFSSSVMLGASAEKLFYLLAIALCDSSTDEPFINLLIIILTFY